MTTPGAQAIVIGGGLNALGVVRSLGAGGIPVAVVASADEGPALSSRFAAQRIVAPMEGPELVRTLIELARAAAEKPVLFLTEEKTVHTVSACRAELEPHCRVRLPTHDTLEALMHKQGFQALAERHDALLPRCVNLRCRDDLPALEGLRFPCIFKPSEKNYQYGARFKKGYVVSSPAEVAELYLQIEPVQADMVVQEWIEGSDADVYFCLQYVGADGRPVASFPGRKVRSWPPRIGGTASCTAAWDDEAELTRLTSEFFARVGFTGMGSMEYKRDRRDGRFYMVEPTVGRTDYQEEVATVHGVNVPLAGYLYETGRTTDPALRPIAPARKLWREPVTDRRSAAVQGGAPEFDALSVCDAHWRWGDPGPWLYRWQRWLRERARGALRRARALLGRCSDARADARDAG